MNGKAWLLCVTLCGCGAASSPPVVSTPDSAQPKSDRSVKRDEAPFNAVAAREAVAAWHTAKDPQHPLETIEVFPVPDAPDLCLAICDREHRWWGFFGLYELQEGRVAWQAECEIEPGEQSVHRVRGLKLSGFTRPIVEAYGETHMGNGNLYLYELRNQSLVLLLKTRAVDSHWGDGETFQDGRLMSEYPDLNGDGFSDLLLNGEVEERTELLENVVAAKRHSQKGFLWNASTGKFEEDRSRRIGLSNDFDR